MYLMYVNVKDRERDRLTDRKTDRERARESGRECGTEIRKNANLPCSCLVLSTVWQAMRHSCSSGDGIRPAEPPTVSSLACHQ